MKKFELLLLLFATVSFAACSNDVLEEAKPEHVTSMSDEQIKGIYLLSSKCFSCHSPESPAVAPDFASIRSAYINEFEDKELFISHMITFLQQPSIENSHMKEAVEQYGLMPKLLFTEQELQFMLNYLYERGVSSDQIKTDFEALASHPTPIFEADYLAKGMEIAMATKSALGKQLMQAIQERGTEAAVEFCNTVAIPLTDSVSNVWNAKVKRVTDFSRNPINVAQPEELSILKGFKETLLQGKQIKPLVIFPSSGSPKAIGYYPIETNSMCLQCHGKPDVDITTQIYSKIKQLYPSDKAVGYGEQELRGMFVVEMND
jgi:cytochrome c551/c552